MIKAFYLMKLLYDSISTIQRCYRYCQLAIYEVFTGYLLRNREGDFVFIVVFLLHSAYLGHDHMVN